MADIVTTLNINKREFDILKAKYRKAIKEKH